MSMSHQDAQAEARAEAYEKVLNNEGFLNDLWNTLGATDKVSLLTKGGFDVLQEYEDSKNIEREQQNDY